MIPIGQQAKNTLLLVAEPLVPVFQSTSALFPVGLMCG